MPPRGKPGRVRVPAIGAQGEQEEQHAQQVLALGNPGDGLHIDGMQRKQRSHHRAAAGESGGPPQHPEEQQNVQHVQQEIDNVRPGGIQPEELEIECM